MSRTLRILAGAAALTSLAMLGWRSLQPASEPATAVTQVSLWTAGAVNTSGIARGAKVHVALPNASECPPGATRISDAAHLRRAFPALRHVTIHGDGLDEADCVPLSGVAITWNRPSSRSVNARLLSLAAPRQLTLGQRLHLEGRIGGLTTSDELTLTLQGPDGAKQSEILRSSSGGDVAFSITSPSAALAPGAFEWKLQAGAQGEPLVIGVVVERPRVPRVLILQSSPGVEVARLQRWLAESGAPVTTRSKISTDRVRVSTANSSIAEFARIDAALLTQCDVVIASESALAELGTDERTALETAVESGAGLLTIGDSQAQPLDGGSGMWSLRSTDNSDEKEQRRVSRLRLGNGAEISEPVTILPLEFAAPAPVRWLARDPLNRTLAAARPVGRGWMARSLVGDTWRWLQAGHPDVFATFWSTILSSIARRENPSGQWMLDHGSEPIFAREALKLVWSGPLGDSSPEAEVHPLGAPDTPVRLEMARDLTEPTTARAIYWLTRSGWHHVRTPSSEVPLAFYVQSQNALPDLRAERRRSATARLAENAPSLNSLGASISRVSAPPPVADWAWLSLFVASVSVLWWQQRSRTS